MFFLIILLIVIEQIDGLVVSNKLTLEKPVSYVHVGFHEITFFLKSNIQSNENKVVLYDIALNSMAVIREIVYLKSNIIKSLNVETYRNTVLDNLYADCWPTGSIMTGAFTNFAYNFSTSAPVNELLFSFGKTTDSLAIVKNFTNSYQF